MSRLQLNVPYRGKLRQNTAFQEADRTWQRYFLCATAGFNAKVIKGENKPFMGRVVSDLHLVYIFWFEENETSERENQRHDQNTVCLLGQKISVEWKTLIIGDFDDFSSGFTPRLHLLRWTTRSWYESILQKQGAFINIYDWGNIANIVMFHNVAVGIEYSTLLSKIEF